MKGDQGDKGDQGERGATGMMGPIGLQGDKGDQGDAGAQGPAGLIWLGTWSSSTSYLIADAVTHNGSAWIAAAPSLNKEPGIDAAWSLLAMKGAR